MTSLAVEDTLMDHRGSLVYQKVVDLILETFVKKPKAQNQRKQHAAKMKDIERSIFDIIHAQPRPILFLLDFYKYLKTAKVKYTPRVGGRVSYFLSRVFHQVGPITRDVREYANNLILQKHIEDIFYGDVMSQFSLVGEFWSPKALQDFVLEVGEEERIKRKGVCKAMVELVTKLSLHDLFAPATLLKLILNSQNQSDPNACSLQQRLCNGVPSYQRALVHLVWTKTKNLKRATKLIKTFSLDPHHFDDIVYGNIKSQLRYFIQSGYFDLVEAVYNQLVDATMKKKVKLWICSHTLRVLGPAHCITRAWVQQFRNEFDSTEYSEVEPPPAGFFVSNTETEERGGYFDIREYIGGENIHFVDVRDVAEKAVLGLVKEPVLGFDCEWVPGLPFEDEVLQIFQVSTEKVSFVFDCNLSKLKDYGDLLGGLFENPGCMKVGYGGKEDKRVLMNAIFDATGIRYEGKNVSDLLPVHRRTKDAGSGLAGFTQHILGKPLSKAQQMSNWSRRPLLDKQLRYAATDAFVCAKMHIELAAREQSVAANSSPSL
jgi:hypothetical protein